MSTPKAKPPLFADLAPGERRLAELHVGELPSGTPIRIRAHLIRGRAPGPTALLLGGVHGDEINGIEIVRRAVTGPLLRDLPAGYVAAIPLLNVYGFLTYSRAVPDGKDVNRSFPGTATGSLASRVAYVLAQYVLPYVDFALDFHTGGHAHFNHPQVRHTPADERSRALALAFNAPITLASRMIAKSLRRTAANMGVPVVVYEGGENARLDADAIAVAQRGIARVLTREGLLSGGLDDEREGTVLRESRWLRAKRAGLFESVVASGAAVVKGQVLGYLRDPYGEWEHRILGPRAATIVGLDNSPVISQGDALFHVGWS